VEIRRIQEERVEKKNPVYSRLEIRRIQEERREK
jgi:hypothetical protein